MSKTALNWKIAGAAGEGVKNTGLMFSKSCLRSGLHTFDYTDYPSLIRGGHNTYQVNAGVQKVYSQEKSVDILVCLNKNAIEFHQEELHQNSIIFIDVASTQIDPSQYKTGQLCNIPLTQIAKDSGAESIMANNVALGASMFVLGLDLPVLFSVIQDTFAKKGDEVVSLNQKVAQAGYDFAQKNCQPVSDLDLSSRQSKEVYSMTGNDAISLGAVAGGCKAYVAYPMTPSSSILHTMASWQEQAEIMVKHAEDEIGVINMALGASFAGVRAAVGTSGGGFAYMAEAIGLSGVAELPLVVFECQRPGPALGMPTWTAQADLLFILHVSQDEFPRILFTPGDVKEAFELSKLSFQLAEDYQIPVILASDKHLSESAESVNFETTTFNNKQTSIDPAPELDDSGMYPRYQPTQSGISKRSIPGQPNGFYISNSYEADQHGLASEESEIRIEQMDKRFRKLDGLKSTIPPQFYTGSDTPDITFISFGSTKSAIRAGVEQLLAQNIQAAMLNISWIEPFPKDQVIQVLENAKNPVVVEGNKTNQLAKLIRMHTGIDIYHKRTKYDGRPFYPSKIVGFAHEILNIN